MAKIDVNCRNFNCLYNEKGNCKLERITLQDNGTAIIDKLICVEAEPKENGGHKAGCLYLKDVGGGLVGECTCGFDKVKR